MGKTLYEIDSGSDQLEMQRYDLFRHKSEKAASWNSSEFHVSVRAIPELFIMLHVDGDWGCHFVCKQQAR